jgi:hypothetical protein
VQRRGKLTFNLLRRSPRKMANLPLIRRAAAMPEEQPLQTLVALELVLEAEPVLLVHLLEQIQQLRTRLHDGEGRALGGHDVDEGCGPGGAVGGGELFEEDLHFLAVGRRHGYKVQALDRVRMGGVLGARSPGESEKELNEEILPLHS